MQHLFSTSGDPFLFPNLSPLLLQVPLCTHIIALEDDEFIFNSILKPLIIEPPIEVVKKQQLDKLIVMANSDDEVELQVPIL